MPGKTKRKYVGELIRFNKHLKRPLNLIQEVLPSEYQGADILNLFRELYPNEWSQIEQRCEHYSAKDVFLEKVHKEKRYFPEQPIEYFFNLQKVKNMLSEGVKKRHKLNFDEARQRECLENLKSKRISRIETMDKILHKRKENIQFVEPLYIDIFINAYHKIGATTESKVEILKEIQKYECKKSLEFLSKVNDSEHNEQLRTMAFKHLQAAGKYVKLRKSFKGKPKKYMTESTDFMMEAKDLYNRLSNDSIQNKKKYDYFISHSYKDKDLIKMIKRAFNKSKCNVYCDWTSDNDFLKRDPDAKHYTELVLKKRIEQSDNIVFIRTNNTNDQNNNILSEWIKMELEYSEKKNKPIFCIDLLNDDKNEFNLIEYDIENNIIKI